MRVVRDTGHTLVLRGVPGGAMWMIFALALGLGIIAACGAFGWVIVGPMVSKGRWSAQGFALIPLGFGALMGLAFAAFGAHRLFSREELVLDRATNSGRYQVRSTLFGRGTPEEFALSRIAHVSLEGFKVKAQRGRAGFDRPALKARLLLENPRHAIELDETQNGREARVRGVAEAVASFLRMEVTEGKPRSRAKQAAG